MKSFLFPALALALVLSVAGCGHLDLMAPGNADRVLTGVVTYAPEEPLPADAEVLVRVVDLSRGEEKPEVLGEETIKGPLMTPVPVRVEYRAEDAQLLRRVNVEVRISVGRTLRYMTTRGHPITLGNVGDPHTIEVDPVR
jgi:uncharacterized lipoprotein YbaY